jgi:hypothetical protein
MRTVKLARNCFDLPVSLQPSLRPLRGVRAISPLGYCTMFPETLMVSKRSLASHSCSMHALSGLVPGSLRQGFAGRSCTRRLSELVFETKLHSCAAALNLTCCHGGRSRVDTVEDDEAW